MPELPQTRQSLLIRLKDRSDDAWVEFLNIYEKSIVDFAKRKGLQDADALDVTQEVLAAVEAKIQTWKTDPSKGKFRGWLFRVARNIAVDKVIERSKKPHMGGTQILNALENAVQQEQDSSAFWDDYRRQLLHWAAEKVRPRVSAVTWQAFWMTAMDGKNADAVAEELGLTRGNVYAAKFRITARIQKLVDQFDDSAEFNLPASQDHEREVN